MNIPHSVRHFAEFAVQTGMMRKMPINVLTKTLAAVAAAALLGSAAWSQEPQQSPPSAEATAKPEGKPAAQGPTAADATKDAPADAAGEGQPEESVLDDQTYEGEDDDFIPTEEIPLNEPIPFPTDI